MRIFRGEPVKPRKIVCAGCGKKAYEAGFAVPESDVEEGWLGDKRVILEVETENEQPLCEECVTALLREKR